MNKIKDIIANNKKILIIIASAILTIILAVIGFVLLSGDNDDVSEKTTEETSSSEMISEDEITSYKENIEEDTTIEKETSKKKEEESIEEQTTLQQDVPAVTPVEYPYLIKVNRIANCVTVYGKDDSGAYTVPVKAITVSCGIVLNDTPVGEFNTITYYDWRLMFGNVYAQYAYRIIGHTLFHSVPYYTQSKNDLEWVEYNKLGQSASLGCIRMTVADCKWLVDNCPIGTRVIIYDDAANPGPWGKPDTIKIPENSPHRGWDPTDPDPANPWHNYSADITYPSTKKIEVTVGAAVESVLKNFNATDTCGNNINDKIKIHGNYNLNKAGTYRILVNVTDAIGKYDEVEISLIVKDKPVKDEDKKPTDKDEKPEENKPENNKPENNKPENNKPDKEEPTKKPTVEEPTMEEQPEEPDTEEPTTEETTTEEPITEEQTEELITEETGTEGIAIEVIE